MDVLLEHRQVWVAQLEKVPAAEFTTGETDGKKKKKKKRMGPTISPFDIARKVRNLMLLSKKFFST